MAIAHDHPTARSFDIAAWLLTGGALLLMLQLHLLPALLALGVVLLLTLAVVGVIAFFRSEAGSIPTLLQKMADILESWRTMLPARVVEQLPEDVGELKESAVALLRAHAGALPHAGAEA